MGSLQVIKWGWQTRLFLTLPDKTRFNLTIITLRSSLTAHSISLDFGLLANKNCRQGHNIINSLQTSKQFTCQLGSRSRVDHTGFEQSTPPFPHAESSKSLAICWQEQIKTTLTATGNKDRLFSVKLAHSETSYSQLTTARTVCTQHDCCWKRLPVKPQGFRLSTCNQMKQS